MIAEKYLKEFDYFGDAAVFTACSVSSPPKSTLALARRFLDECASSYGNVVFEHYWNRRDEARSHIAAMVGAGADDIAFTMNTTEGNNILASGLSLVPGDSVVVVDMEYPGTVIPWIQKQSEGVRLNIVRSVDGCVRTEDVLAAMDARTRVVALSWVQSHSGHKLDCAAIGRACRRRGIWFAVDGIQGLGRNVMDVEEYQIDFLSAAGFKGLLGTLGAGFVYCRKALLDELKPLGVGEENLAAEYEECQLFSAQPLKLRQDSKKLEFGSLNTYGIMVMDQSVQLLLDIGIDTIEKRIRELERHYRSTILDSGLPVRFLGSDDEAGWSGNISLTCDASRTEMICQQFAKDQIYATIKDGYVRIGIHFYNTTEQLDRVVRALKAALY